MVHENISSPDFPEEYQKLWDNRKLNEELSLPATNLYIPSNFDIVYDDSMKDITKVRDSHFYYLTG